MKQNSRGSLVAGSLLILLGGWFLLTQLAPGLFSWFDMEFSWPMIIIGVGAIFLIAGLISGEYNLAVPAAVIGGIGCLLYWQNVTGNWLSWAYAWTLIPGFVGVGIIVAGVLGKNPGRALREGLSVIIVSVILFAIFASFLGGWNIFGPYWPVLLILLGIWFMIRPFWRTHRE